MISLNVDVLFLLYFIGGFGLIFGLWFYYDRREKQQHAAHSTKVIYHCIKCSQIYTSAGGHEECDCPQCGFTNGRLKF